ncbi:MAG: protein translocase subunit SecDF, partial [Schleiferiaceae bacterium]|nr:protein translocase subunit SecDF [Schleiferiaceae bacterium]
MQNKVIIRLFAIAFALASLYELSFTWMSQRVESQIAEQVNHDPERLNYALDSLSDHTVYDIGVASFTYKELKSKEMNLGLDLRGGMNVILEVSVRDVLLGLAGDADDAQLRQAIEEADAAQTN